MGRWVRTLARCLLAALTLGCSREPANPLPPASVAPRGADASPPMSTGEPTFSEGAHDYRGTLGRETSIAVHLARSGQTVSGFYVYLGVGTAIPLSGTVDATTGALVLTEGTTEKPTGTLHLHSTGGDLAGEWANPKGDKVFPIRLSPGAPWAAPTFDAGASASQKAESCLADPFCAAGEADRLFLAADSARAPELDCFRFLDGAGVGRDLRRGRACLERGVSTSKCEGGSAGLDRAELAVMLIDGKGGAADVPRARALFAGCFEDVTASYIHAHADAKEHDPHAAPADFCKDNGGTTLTSNECGGRALTEEETRLALATKVVVARLDEESARLLVAASKAYAAYVSAMGGYAYDVFVDGSIRNMMMLGRERELDRARTKELGELGHFTAPETSAEDVSRAEKRAAAALAAVTSATPAEKTALDATAAAWSAYRDAEVRFYVKALGPKQGADRVERAVRVRLETRRAKECAPPSAQGG
jgi:uncharacterized protein YecT (DUF1311 family)